MTIIVSVEMKCTFPRYNLRDNSLQLVARHLLFFHFRDYYISFLYVHSCIYFQWKIVSIILESIHLRKKFFDFTILQKKKKKKRPFQTTIVAARRHVTITRAKILRVSGKVVIPRFLAIVSHSICQRGCIFSLSFLSYSKQRKSEEKRSSCIRPFFFHENCFWIVSSFFLLFSEHCYNIESFLLSLYLCKDATQILYIYMSESDVAFSSFWIRYSELNIVEQRYIFA